MWYVQCFEMASAAQASGVEASIDGGGTAGGVVFPVTTKAIAIREYLFVAVDDADVALASQEASKSRYRSGVATSSLGSVPVQFLGLETLADVKLIAQKLA